MAPTSVPPAKEALPRHVAIIMDGNGRWARKRHLPRAAGHVAGVSAVREHRSRASRYRARKSDALCVFVRELEAAASGSDPSDGIVPRLFPRGRRTNWSSATCICASSATARGPRRHSRHDRGRRKAHGTVNTGLNLTFAFDYGAQEEIAAAARDMAREAAKANSIPKSSRRNIFDAAVHAAAFPIPISSSAPAASAGSAISCSGNRPMRNSPLSTRCGRISRAEFFEVLNAYALRERRFGTVAPEAVA
jgi:undecaprenyl diphosphate synthase